MTSFLSEVYFFHKRGVQFSLLFCIHCSFSHFRFDVPVHPGDVEMVTFEMQSSFHEFVSHISHAESMLDSLYKGVRSVDSIC